MQHHAKPSHGSTRPYGRLALMMGLSFVAMFVLMYAMVDRLPNVLININQAYMAALMLVPMVGLELLLMRHMYTNRGLNLVVLLIALGVGVTCWIGIRQQVAVTDDQFLRSMIPHHAGAILMCERAPIEDPSIQQLCAEILRSQRSEIDRMRQILRLPD